MRMTSTDISSVMGLLCWKSISVLSCISREVSNRLLSVDVLLFLAPEDASIGVSFTRSRIYRKASNKSLKMTARGTAVRMTGNAGMATAAARV